MLPAPFLRGAAINHVGCCPVVGPNPACSAITTHSIVSAEILTHPRTEKTGLCELLGGYSGALIHLQVNSPKKCAKLVLPLF